MTKSVYKSFFYHPEINFSDQIYFGASHFFNRTKVKFGAVNYDEILPRSKKTGRILLGQLPVETFTNEMLTELSGNGLIVACNESYELAGFATAIQVIPPFYWEFVGIDHYHLPFIDFTDKVNPDLMLEAIFKIIRAYERGATVYLHCKAGRSRSPLLAALVNCIIHLEQLEQRNNFTEERLRELLNSEIARLTSMRPQISIDQDKINLGIRILQQYLLDIDPNLAKKENIYTQSSKFFAKLTQSSEFKALWYFAYNNSQYLADMQKIMDALYEAPLKILAVLENLKNDYSKLAQVCRRIDENESGRILLQNLKHFLERHKNPEFQSTPSRLTEAYQKYNEALIKYSGAENIMKAARQLQSDIFLSPEHNEDKINWLHRTANFLNDPEKQAHSYYINAENAVLSDNPEIRRLGKAILIFAAITLSCTFLAGVISSSIFTFPIIITLSLISLAFIGIGVYLTGVGTEYNIKDNSRALVNEVEANYIESVQFQ